MRIQFPTHTEHGTRNTKRVFRLNASTLPRFNGFTLIEILIAIGIFSMVLAAIYSSWTAILRASKVGLDAAAAVQRSRIVLRTLEDSLLCAQSFALNQRYYAFVAQNGSDATLSFVSRLPESFPRNRKFGDFHLRRVTFAVESGPQSSRQLVLRQCPLLMDVENDKDEMEHPLVLAKYVSEFQMEFWEPRRKEWVDEWKDTYTNQLPKLIKISLKLGDNAYTPQRAQQEITRIVSLPSMTVQPDWQFPRAGPRPPGPLTPIPLNQGQPPGVNPGVNPNVNPGFRPQ